MRVAVVHDWLYVLGGAERVLKEVLRCYPGAQVFTLFDVLNDEQRAWLGYTKARTSFLQHVPRIGKVHRNLLPLMPLAVEQLDLSGYDLVISSSYAVAKGVITGPDQLHVSYIHSPMRYAWDLQNQYLKESGGGLGIKNAIARSLLHRMRIWDMTSGSRPDALIANSAYIARRIKKTFGRQAAVINPPVGVTPAAPNLPRQSHFLTAGRLVGYKNVEVVIDAFKLLPEQKLIVAGTGPEEKRLRALAGPNVAFTGFVTEQEMRQLMATARALIFAAEEDFGIIPVEAQAEGTPVLALARGGALETVVADGPAPTGMFFSEPTAQHVAACVGTFLTRQSAFTREACQRQARRFDSERFRSQLMAFIENELDRAKHDRYPSYAALQSPQLSVAE